MIVRAATGHRPDKLGGYSPQVDAALVGLARWFLIGMQTDRAVSGMALGWDMAFAEAALSLGVPVIAALPFANQACKWPVESQRRHARICEQALQVVIVCEGEYAAWKMQERNKWMVHNSDEIVALWDGSEGGTGNCIKAARLHERHIFNLWDFYKRGMTA